MDLEQLNVAVRPRRYGEAIDLGFRMAARSWAAIATPWMVVVLPLPALGFVLLYEHPYWVLAIAWWLKPLYDRVALHVVSRSVFDATPSPVETLRALPGLLWPQLLQSLTLRRLDPLRAFHLPVAQLERLSGRAYVERRRLLARGATGDALGLIGTCYLFELILTLAPVLLAVMLFDLGDVFVELWEKVTIHPDPAWAIRAGWIGVACWIVGMTIVEPFYVAAAFALYLNRRTLLEAWDIEVAFRRMAQRLSGERSRAASLLVLCLLGAGWTARSSAEPVEEGPAAVDAHVAAEGDAAEGPDPAEVVAEVLLDRDFGWERTIKERTFGGGSDGSRGFGGLGMGGALAALIGRIVVVLVLIGVVIGCIVLLMRAAFNRTEKEPEPEVPPVVVLGLEVTAASLPDDVPGEALALWRNGDRVGAIRLLYRASLTRLIEDGLPVKDSATEGDCLRLAREHREAELARFLERLTGIWIHAAYGHELPPEDVGEPLIGGWRAHFEAPS